MSIAQTLIDRVAKTLIDDLHERWEESELLGFISDAQREVVLIKPSAYTKSSSVQLVAGTVQTIPADGTNFVDIGGNMGVDGNTPGRSVTQIDRTNLEAFNAEWRTSASNINAQHYIHDDRAPMYFEVFPPQPLTPGYVQLMYCAVPPVLETVNDSLVIAEIYDTPIYYIALAQAFMKSTDTEDQARAVNYLALAHQLITGRKVAKKELHPEQVVERVKR